jgi:UTP--glucose-1-phosphate uridylyltransferase
MGAAIEVFEGATAIAVGRDRFLPVKTTNDLLVLRSDVYEVGPDGRLTKITDSVPLVDLDSRYYKTISAFDRRFTSGVPSLRGASKLSIEGDWTFGHDVTIVGAVQLDDRGAPRMVPAGSVLGVEGAES